MMRMMVLIKTMVMMMMGMGMIMLFRQLKSLCCTLGYTAVHNVHFGYYVYLPTEQAETNIC